MLDLFRILDYVDLNLGLCLGRYGGSGDGKEIRNSSVDGDGDENYIR